MPPRLGKCGWKEASEPSRQRQLAQIEAQLAEFGIEPPARQTEEQKPHYFMMILENEG
jgi:hypothetical protein